MMWRPDPPEKLGHLVDVIQSGSEPATRDDGAALVAGDMWRDTSVSPSVWSEWDGSQWVATGGGSGLDGAVVSSDGESIVISSDGESVVTDSEAA